MANITVVKHYIEVCNKPAAIVLGTPVRAFLKDDVTRIDGAPYLEGTITALVQRSDGGWDASFTYDGATISGGFVATFPTGGSAGTIADPLSFAEGEWLWTVEQMVNTPGIGDIYGLGTGIEGALATNIGVNGSPVLRGGTGGTPSSLTLSNATGLPPAGVVGTAATLAGVEDLSNKSITGTTVAMTGAITSSSPTAGMGYTAGCDLSVARGGSVAAPGAGSGALCGEILIASGTLAANGTFVFTVTGTPNTADDYVAVRQCGLGTAAAYNIMVACSANSLAFTVRNVSGASLTEQIKLQYIIWRAARV